MLNDVNFVFRFVCNCFALFSICVFLKCIILNTTAFTFSFWAQADSATHYAEFSLGDFNVSLNSNMRFGIDKTDRLFAMWALGGTTYYMYCNTDSTPVSWSIPKRIHSDIDYSSTDFTNGLEQSASIIFVMETFF